MATAKQAIDALMKVGKDTFLANAADPTWGAILYAILIWETGFQYEAFDNLEVIRFYKTGDSADNQGLGTAKEWRQGRVRMDILCTSRDKAEQAFEFLRTAWITDFDYVNGAGTVGQGYLRAQGIKYLQIGESRETEWDRRGLVFRRIADVLFEIGD